MLTGAPSCSPGLELSGPHLPTGGHSGKPGWARVYEGAEATVWGRGPARGHRRSCQPCCGRGMARDGGWSVRFGSLLQPSGVGGFRREMRAPVRGPDVTFTAKHMGRQPRPTEKQLTLEGSRPLTLEKDGVGRTAVGLGSMLERLGPWGLPAAQGHWRPPWKAPASPHSGPGPQQKDILWGQPGDPALPSSCSHYEKAEGVAGKGRVALCPRGQQAGSSGARSRARRAGSANLPRRHHRRAQD